MKVYVFERTSTGIERAYMDTDDPNTIRYSDIVEHEDYEWSEWRLVEVYDD